MHIPLPLLEKLESYELAPQYSWSEVSKALEDLKPSLHKQNPKAPPPSAAVEKRPQPPSSSPVRPPPPEISGLHPVKKTAS
ncbi:uncharacterized protein M6B38_222635 [Iris pallida]|uniref:Uncharacterized protein n=1 Tax=Iris pallida TaxID=29817 RepID=A0AAX6DWR6_IRIPA|nr:uncharacterized protein M6B38_222635 [Iris pallida]